MSLLTAGSGKLSFEAMWSTLHRKRCRLIARLLRRAAWAVGYAGSSSADVAAPSSSDDFLARLRYASCLLAMSFMLSSHSGRYADDSSRDVAMPWILGDEVEKTVSRTLPSGVLTLCVAQAGV